jgi:hypothetical protein
MAVSMVGVSWDFLPCGSSCTDTLYTVPQGIFIDTAVKPSQKTVFFDLTWYPSVERLFNSDSMETKLWSPITVRNHEYGDTFSETSVLT